MALKITNNFYIPKLALRNRNNAKVWGLLSSGKKLKYERYSYGKHVDDTIFIDNYELPVIWDIMTGNPAMLNCVDGTMTITDKAKALLAEIKTTYNGKYKILGAIYVTKKPQISKMQQVFRDAVNTEYVIGNLVDYYDNKNNNIRPTILVAVEEKIRNKKTVRVYDLNLQMPLHNLANDDGFNRYVAISRENVIKEINTFLTDNDRANMAELMLNTKEDDERHYHVRDYISTFE